MSKLFLSNSQINTYTDCPRKWHLDKQQRLRPNWKGSALLFGSALDSAVESYLLKNKLDPRGVFNASLAVFEVNGEEKKLPTDLLDVRFFAGDVDPSLLDQEFMDQICVDNLGIETMEISVFLDFCKQQRKTKTALSKVEQKLFNWLAYASLKIKGLMLLEELLKWIDENVLEVHEVQKKIQIENEDGDTFIGFLDFIVTIGDAQCRGCQGTGYSWDDAENRERVCDRCPPHRKVLIDLKTSSNPKAYYPEDAAETSVQLGIYAQEEGIEDVAYLVGDKKIRKREPRVRLHFIEGKITEEHLDEVFEMIEEATLEIKENLKLGEEGFPKNLDSCANFGGCQYFNYCKKGDMKGLCYVKKV